ncbi:MAG: DNA-binding transcriptional LysR family regulator [Gammaproteobacteria bacterium]|jgi:DNA-binding transcriptional LysR family regulator
MDWRSVKFDWNRARAFLVTAEEGSLAAAARALDMTQPTLGRQVAALEQEIGVDLFNRRGRGLELTPNGMKLVEHVRAMGDAANRFSLSATGKSDIIEGNICITTTEYLATFILPPMIQKLRQSEPGIEIEIISTNEESNLNRREADIAIRSFRPSQPELIVKKLFDAKAHLYAATTYLQRLGNPKSIAELNSANFIDIEKSGRLLSLLNAQGFNLSENNFPVITKSHIVQWELVKQGVAITGTLEQIGDSEPLVERVVVPGLAPITAEVWIVTHKELRTNRRVRRVFDFLVSEFASYQHK